MFLSRNGSERPAWIGATKFASRPKGSSKAIWSCGDFGCVLLSWPTIGPQLTPISALLRESVKDAAVYGDGWIRTSAPLLMLVSYRGGRTVRLERQTTLPEPRPLEAGRQRCLRCGDLNLVAARFTFLAPARSCNAPGSPHAHWGCTRCFAEWVALLAAELVIFASEN
jgi:hypothetical protein